MCDQVLHVHIPIPGMLVMKDLGIEVELYISSEVDPDAIKVIIRN